MEFLRSTIGYLLTSMLAFAAAPMCAHAQSGPPPQPLPGGRDIQEPIFPPGPWGTCLVGCPREPATPWFETHNGEALRQWSAALNCYKCVGKLSCCGDKRTPKPRPSPPVKGTHGS